MEKSPNKINVEEIQPIFTAKPNKMGLFTNYKPICTQAKQNKKRNNFYQKKKPFHKKKKVNPTENT